MFVGGRAAKEILKHYLLDDRQCRRAMLALVGVFNLMVVIAATLIVGRGGRGALLLWIMLFSSCLGTGWGAPYMLTATIHREKAEGSFGFLCALPIPKRTLFLGAVLAGIVGSAIAFLPGYVIGILALTLSAGGGQWTFLPYPGLANLLVSFLSSSLMMTVAMNVNSPTVLGYMIAALFVGLQFPGFLLLSDRIEEKVQALLEPHLWELMAFLFSVRGQFFVGAVLLGLSLLTLCVGVWIFRRKGSYV
jgi:hypothetical protein